jgi:GNAT superfamily N-acetyltransferase
MNAPDPARRARPYENPGYLRELGVRLATVEEIPVLVEFTREFNETTRFREYRHTPKRIAAQLRMLIEGRGFRSPVFIAEDSAGRPVGTLIGWAQDMIFTEELVAGIMFFWVLPGHAWDGAALRLLRAFARWALELGVKSINASITSGEKIEEYERVFKALGFTYTGGNFSFSTAAMTPAARRRLVGETGETAP